MDSHSDQATADAALAGDPLADIAAIRARHQVLHGPEHAGERLELERLLGEAAREQARPTAALWEPGPGCAGRR